MFSRLGIVVFILCLSSLSFSAFADQRPFWTEKSTFIEGDTLFAVGIASNSRTIEAGRELAFRQGSIEVMNYAQIANLEGTGITLETQMTYEEQNDNGTYNVYRLLKTDVRKLLLSQKRQQTTSQARMKELNQMIDINRTLIEGFVAKRRELEKATQQLESTKTELAVMARRGKETLQELEAVKQYAVQKQEELEFTYRAIRERIRNREAAIRKLREQKAEYDSQDVELQALFSEIQHRVVTRSDNAKNYIVRGMTKNDVLALLGQPDSIKSQLGNHQTWYYGSTEIHFKDQTNIVRHVQE